MTVPGNVEYSRESSSAGEEVRSSPRDNLRQDSVPPNALVSVNRLRTYLTRRLNEVHGDVSSLKTSYSQLVEQVSAIESSISACLNSLKSLEESQGALQALSRVPKPRRKIPKIPVSEFSKGASFKDASRPLLKYLIIGTVLSFVHAMPSVRFWVSDQMWTKMTHFSGSIAGSQGFAATLFAMRNNDKVVANTPPGKLWMFILSGGLQSVLASARSKFRRAAPGAVLEGSSSAVTRAPIPLRGATRDSETRPVEPDWLSRFATTDDIVQAVVDSMKKFAGSGNEISASSGTGGSPAGMAESMDGSSIRGSRTARNSESATGSSRRGSRKRKAADMESDSESAYRREIVSQIRSTWLEPLSNCRQQVRKHLFMKLTCVLDKIVRSKSVSAARAKGYEIILHGYESDVEEIAADDPNLEHTIWKIDDAHVDPQARTDRRNMALREKLEANFPSLHVTICYKREIRSMGGSGSPSNDSEGHGTVRRFEDKREKVSLHEVAHGVLMEAFAMETMEATLAASPLSLKAVHVISIALRGLIVTVLDAHRERKVGLSSAEKAAFGSDVSLNDESNNKFMVMIEKTAPNGKMSEFYNKCYAAKFQTTDRELAQESNRGEGRAEQGRAGEISPALGSGMSLLGAWTEFN